MNASLRHSVLCQNAQALAGREAVPKDIILSQSVLENILGCERGINRKRVGTFFCLFLDIQIEKVRWAERTARMRGENCVQRFSLKNKEPKFQILCFNFYTKSDGLAISRNM